MLSNNLAQASLIAALLNTASFGVQPPAQPSISDPQRTVDLWMNCEECTAGELQAVVKLGAAAIPSLTESLLNGVPKARRDAHGQFLAKRYQALKEYEKSHPDPPVAQSEQEFVNRYLDKYESLQRIRAARALGLIGGPRGRAVLDQALKLKLKPEVLAVVKEARAKI
jgi:hypothetical protein